MVPHKLTTFDVSLRYIRITSLWYLWCGVCHDCVVWVLWCGVGGFCGVVFVMWCLWCGVCGVVSVVFVMWCLWCGVCGVMFMVLCLWCGVCDMVFVVWCLWYCVCGAVFVMWCLWCGVCGWCFNIRVTLLHRGAKNSHWLTSAASFISLISSAIRSSLSLISSLSFFLFLLRFISSFRLWIMMSKSDTKSLKYSILNADSDTNYLCAPSVYI